MFSIELIEKIRAEFPRAEIDLSGTKRAFFDNGTGSLVLQRAADNEYKSRIDCSANIGGIFEESKMALKTVEAGRQAVASYLNAPSSETIISGESATKLFFDVSYALGKTFKGKENIVTTDLEHYANVSQWLELERRGKVKEVRFARLNKEDGTLDLEHLKELIDKNTRVITVTAASNVLGTKLPLEAIGKIAKKSNAYYIVDGVHHVPHGPVDVQKIGCDFLNFSMYKLFGPHGSFMFAKEEHIEELTPFKVKPSKNYGPFKWESGTRNQAMFAAICGVMDHFMWLAEEVQSEFTDKLTEYEKPNRDLKIAMYAIEEYLQSLSKIILDGVDEIPGLLNIPKIKIHGITDSNRISERDPTFAFTVEGMPPEKVIEKLWSDGGIAMRTGNFYSYAQEVINELNIPRLSLVHYNTIDEVKTFLATLNRICSK